MAITRKNKPATQNGARKKSSAAAVAAARADSRPAVNRRAKKTAAESARIAESLARTTATSAKSSAKNSGKSSGKSSAKSAKTGAAPNDALKRASAARVSRAKSAQPATNTRTATTGTKLKRAGATIAETPPSTARTRRDASSPRVGRPAKADDEDDVDLRARRGTAATAASRTAVTATRPTAKASPAVAAKLARYRSKRDFGKTPEPQGKTTSQWKKANNPFFVIQKHDATRLHYDFRLEVDGVLKSWAVPKGPSMDPRDKRLAVETEDHPIDYADFEGIIPKDEYGGGTVIVWDAGPYRNLKRRGASEVPMSEAYDRGTIEVWLEGKKIRGGFALIHSRMGDNEKNWLLVKMKDQTADPESDPVAERTESVLSGRTIEDVQAKPKKVWHSNR
jgi:DNA ligase D-like protein (predicted 3'-phosphoesterase)